MIRRILRFGLPLLAPFELLFRLVVMVRNASYDRGWRTTHTLPGKTISVGNLTVGGTGKSPVVMELAHLLIAMGYQPAILTRGYRSGLAAEDSMTMRGSEILQQPLQKGCYTADEARMQAQMLETVPVIVGARRWEAAQRYLQEFPAPDVWILDDGFQHRRIHRDWDLVLINGDQAFGNRRLLPWGILREPTANLKRCHAIGLTTSHPRKHLAPRDRQLMETFGKVLIPILFHSDTLRPLQETITHMPRRAIVVTAIARPQRVTAAVESLAEVAGTIVKADHHRFQRGEILTMLENTRPDAVITTAKDYWRDPGIFHDLGVPAFILEQSLTWHPELVRQELQKIF